MEEPAPYVVDTVVALGKQPAFPAASRAGLTKREYFAIHIYQGMMAAGALHPDAFELAVVRADELLKRLHGTQHA